MNAKNELKILELKLKLLTPRFCKVELLLNQILTIISILVYYKEGLLVSIIIGIVLNWIVKKTYLKTIKKEQTRLNI
jgi:hypothetical protein